MYYWFCFMLLCVHQVCLTDEPGLIFLRSSNSLCSLNKHTLWLEKHMPSTLKIKSIDDFKYVLKQSDVKNNVVFLTSLLYPYEIPLRSQKAKNQTSSIICAQSMFEASEIPRAWVERLNRKFDFVTVPCDFCKEVYRNSGVKIPIFVLPLGCFLENWLDLCVDMGKKKPFVFITSGCLTLSRKNQELLIQAFIDAFGDSEDVLLKLQIRDTGELEKAEAIIRHYDLTKRKNVQLHYGSLNDNDYRDFFLSGNCLVNITAGEGYSITPREALAVGMPVIVTNNSAQVDLCRTGYVRAVESPNVIPAMYPFFGGQIGYQWNPTREMVKEALLDVYNNYESYVELAHKARPWIIKQTAPYLLPRWQTLLHPKKIILGEKNEVTDEYLMTDSKTLYLKYRKTMNMK